MESRIIQSRADTVRQRRSSRPRKNNSSLTVKRGKKYATTTQPPILIRGGLAGTPVTEKPRGKKAKRRYDVALNTPGVEIQLPSLPRIALGWRLLSGLLVGLLGTAAYFLWTSPLLQVESLQVEGLRRLTSEDLNSVVDVVGQSILYVEPASIQEDLMKAFPDLSEVSVAIEIPASVVVKAVERLPTGLPFDLVDGDDPDTPARFDFKTDDVAGRLLRAAHFGHFERLDQFVANFLGAELEMRVTQRADPRKQFARQAVRVNDGDDG